MNTAIPLREDDIDSDLKKKERELTDHEELSPNKMADKRALIRPIRDARRHFSLEQTTFFVI